MMCCFTVTINLDPVILLGPLNDCAFCIQNMHIHLDRCGCICMCMLFVTLFFRHNWLVYDSHLKPIGASLHINLF